MKYTTVIVRQLTSRKGKPWQARAKYKDVYGNWKEVILTRIGMDRETIKSLLVERRTLF